MRQDYPTARTHFAYSFLGAEDRLRAVDPPPTPARPAVDVASMTDDELEAYLNSLVERNPRRDRLHGRFRDVADDAEVDAYLAMYQAGSKP